MDNPRTVDSTSAHVMEEEANRETSLVKDIKSLIKVGIINSNLITTFAGFWLALYYTGASIVTEWVTLLWTLLGTALVIAGGCILNNWYDRDIDPIMDRTQNRPTVTGTMSLQSVLIGGLVTSAAGFLVLTLASWQAALWGVFGWIVYVILYTMWSKRRYTLNTVIGSFSGAVPPLIGWAAIEPGLRMEAWMLFLIMFLWQTPHFLALAMKKKDDYERAGVPMLPVVKGFEMTKRQIVVYVACLLPLPLYLASLGGVFLTVAYILSVGWLVLALAGFVMKDDKKWATWMFVYSLNYLTILFLTMVLVTMPFPYV
ncbi:protoheme IX farnesyltransferase [Salimicrobium jeotgali]|uniref:Protoheme IX farnesyltransferase n=2 Tax=Salimicrobium TaxID=351195 RepID=K2H819_9BACI|nr:MULTISPECIES: heme o synthase [Salimicrobium]AKG05735.1 protoheme IX farnesyltransferase [Salimicrobium jeotgali]EKE31825.1 protoheme IX farnesyltransferase [Salimicrobium jeotgali]PBB05343.1 protoheme IX farnesyltransferase [Salimicrobium humidisoli]